MTASSQPKVRVKNSRRRFGSITTIMVCGALAALVCSQLTFDRKSVNALLAEMRSDDPEIAAAAEQRLRESGARAVPDLIVALYRKNPPYRDAYHAARRRLPGLFIGMVPEMHERALDRQNALNVLATFGPAAKPAISKIVTLMGDDDARVQITAIQSLGALGSNAIAAVPNILVIVKTNQPYWRVLAARSLWQIDGVTHEQVVTEAAVSVIGGGYSVTEQGVGLLKEMDKADLAIAPLVQSLKSSNKDARRVEAAIFLGRLAPISKPAVPELTEALFDKAAGVRQSAAEALGNIGADAHSALPYLYEAAHQSHIPCAAFDNAIAKIEGRPEQLSSAVRATTRNRAR